MHTRTESFHKKHSIIGHIIMTDKLQCEFSLCLIEHTISDHHLLLLHINCECQVKCSNLKFIDYKQIFREINDVNLDKVKNFDDWDSIFSSNLKETFSQLYPKIKKLAPN